MVPRPSPPTPRTLSSHLPTRPCRTQQAQGQNGHSLARLGVSILVSSWPGELCHSRLLDSWEGPSLELGGGCQEARASSPWSVLPPHLEAGISLVTGAAVLTEGSWDPSLPDLTLGARAGVWRRGFRGAGWGQLGPAVHSKGWCPLHAAPLPPSQLLRAPACFVSVCWAPGDEEWEGGAKKQIGGAGWRPPSLGDICLPRLCSLPGPRFPVLCTKSPGLPGL